MSPGTHRALHRCRHGVARARSAAPPAAAPPWRAWPNCQRTSRPPVRTKAALPANNASCHRGPRTLLVQSPRRLPRSATGAKPMKQPSVYLKMRVLGAVDTVEGRTRHERVHHVAAMTFLDEEGNARRFTWRTIQTWYYRYKNHGITGMTNQPRKD